MKKARYFITCNEVASIKTIHELTPSGRKLLVQKAKSNTDSHQLTLNFCRFPISVNMSGWIVISLLS